MRKSLRGVTIKNADLGEIEAVFATFDVIDLDNDVTVKGAFTEGQKVVISSYGHKSHEGALPVGFGTIHEVDDRAILKGQYFMDIPHAAAEFATVKALSEEGLQEWSYHLAEVKASRGTVNGRNVRIIEKVGLVKEVSPVLLGAGIDTRTVAVKGVKQLASQTRQALHQAARERWGDEDAYAYVYVDDYDPDESTAIILIEADEYRLIQVSYTIEGDTVVFADDETEVVRTVAYARKGSKFSERTDAALVAVKSLVGTAAERLSLRAPEGKSVAEQIDAYERLMVELSALKSAIDATQPTTSDDAEREFVRAVSAINL